MYFFVSASNCPFANPSLYCAKFSSSPSTSALKEVISCDFEVIDHLAGVRPTVKDRRPLLGKHNLHNHLYILNGLGTRGVLFAPYLSDKLYQYIENGIPLDNEISIERCYKKLFR